jgi:hypothetical protein
MNARHFLIFAAWSLVTIIVTSGLLFVFTYGDCLGESACVRNTNRAFWLIVGSAFLIYWAVSISLFRRWSR